MYVSRTDGSLSPRSTETHATGRPLCSAHWASNVVLPYPGGAITAIIEADEADQSIDQISSRHESGREPGGWSFDSSRSNGGWYVSAPPRRNAPSVLLAMIGRVTNSPERAHAC